MYLAGKARRDDPITRRLVFLGKELSRQFEDLLAEHDCTIPTWAVLRHASQHPDLSQVQLAGQIGIEGPTLTRHLDKLCAEGLVSRRRDDADRRIIRISLTPRGLRRWRELHGVVEALDARFTALLTPKQLAALDDVLCSITHAMEDAHVVA
jgi:MarR family transcriptional regulator for hemolysin